MPSGGVGSTRDRLDVVVLLEVSVSPPSFGTFEWQVNNEDEAAVATEAPMGSEIGEVKQGARDESRWLLLPRSWPQLTGLVFGPADMFAAVLLQYFHDKAVGVIEAETVTGWNLERHTPCCFFVCLVAKFRRLRCTRAHWPLIGSFFQRPKTYNIIYNIHGYIKG